jgi:hypothetical protein
MVGTGVGVAITLLVAHGALRRPLSVYSLVSSFVHNVVINNWKLFIDGMSTFCV